MPRFAKGKAVNGGKSQIKQNNQTQNANHYSDNGVVNDKNSDDIMELTYDVNSFSNAMTRLKESLKNRKSNNDDSIEEWVGEVVSILKRITEKNTDLVSNSEIMTSTRTLLLKVNDYSINECTEKEVIEAAVHLELALTDGITDLIDDQSENNDLESDSKESNTNDSQIDISPGSIDYLQSKAAGTRDRVHSKDPQAIDHLLQKTDNSMEISLQYAKSWLKYAKEISTYVEKRSRLELDYAKSLSKLAQQTRQAITEEPFLPLQSVFCTSVDSDIEYSNVVQQLYNNQLNLKFTEPLNTRRNEHDAARKILKDSWMKLDKKYQDAKNNIKKAKNNYKARVQEHVKFKSSTKGEIITGKKKREEDEIKHRIEDADVTLKAATVEAEGIQENLQKSKDKFLVELRQLILQCDVTLKAVTANYFQMRNTALSPFPVQYQTLSDNAKMYEPGTQFIEFLSHRPENAEVEPPSATADMDRYNFSSRRQEEEDGLSTDPLNRSYDSSKSLASAFQEDLDGSVKHKNASTDLEPDEAYKHRGRRDGGQVARALAIELFSSPGPFANMALSTPAKTHVLRKLKSPSRCQECDSFLYFSGAECERCGLTCHKKCLEKLSISCGSKHHRKLSTFGVDIHDHLVATNQIGVPIIVSVCINEIDKRGLKTQGIYRISGVKSQVEKLCQFFESMDSSKDMKIDLSKTPVHHIASVLRLYLRQLPEPLLTFRFYEPFIELAKESFKMPEEELIKEALRLVEKLPESNYKTCQKIVAHLKRIHDNYEDNKMSAANLGIVFGPTILGRRQTEDAKEGYKDMSFQARMVELLILNQAKIFRYTQEDTETNDEQDENAALENSTTVSSDDPSDPSHLTTSGNKSSDDLSATSKSNDSQPLPQNENVDYPDNTEDISSDDDSEYDSDFITVHHNQTKNEDQLKRKNSIKHEIKNSNDLDYVPPAIYHESNDDFMQEEDELNNSQISFSTGSLKSDEYMEFLSTESAQDVMTKSSSHNIIREVTTRKAHRSASDIGRYNDKRLARLDFNPPLTLPINPIPFTCPPKPVTPSSQSITLNKSVSVPDREPNYAKPSIAGDHFDPVYEYMNESLNDPNHAYNKPHHSPSESNLTANLRQRQYEQLSQQQTTNVNTFRSSKLRHRHSLDHQRAGIYREHLRERGYSATNSEFAATNSGDENPRVKYV